MKIRSGLILVISVVSLLGCQSSTGDDGGVSADVEDASLPSIDIPNGVDIPNVAADVVGCMPDGASCGAGCANCGAGCVSTLSDNMNCGGCGNTCGAGRTCQGGMCACAPGNMMCGGLCINTMTDSMNCGACGNTCPMGRTCLGGTCQINCTMPTELCVVAGVSSCVNTQSDPANCGGCGTVCTSANATAACGGGRCSLGPCNRGYGNCDRQAGNGCELNLNSDGANCGGCDNVCPSPPNASASCTLGVCGVGACNRGFGNCDGNLVNGCETNTLTDASNCNACGNRCPMGQGCLAGACQVLPGPVYNPVGPQNNVPVMTVTDGGWTQCYSSTYIERGTPLATIRAQCNRTNVMVACRRTGAATLQLLAQAPRVDVFFDTGHRTDVVHVANGTGWYYSENCSLGYAAVGQMVNRSTSCADTNGVADGNRMSLNTETSRLAPGWRCGANINEVSANFERVFYHAD